MSSHAVSRRIEIDAAHRIPDHRSKCRHLHGHRYVVEAECRGARLQTDGAERGMVVDFGFLKELMRREIDAPCDHGLIVSLRDTALLERLAPDGTSPAEWMAGLAATVERDGHAAERLDGPAGRLYVIAPPPTAEVLAEHWFHRLAPGVTAATAGAAVLARVTVRETPNCQASYTAEGP